MNEQERKYFKLLSKDRMDSANTLEKPSMQGVKNSIVEKIYGISFTNER